MIVVDEQNRRRRISPFRKKLFPDTCCDRVGGDNRLPDSHLEDTVSTTNEGPL